MVVYHIGAVAEAVGILTTPENSQKINDLKAAGIYTFIFFSTCLKDQSFFPKTQSSIL